LLSNKLPAGQQVHQHDTPCWTTGNSCLLFSKLPAGQQVHRHTLLDSREQLLAFQQVACWTADSSTFAAGQQGTAPCFSASCLLDSRFIDTPCWTAGNSSLVHRHTPLA